MDKQLNLFFKKKILSSKTKTRGGKNLLIVNRNTMETTLRLAFLSSYLNKYKNFDIHLLSHKPISSLSFKIYKNLNLESLIYSFYKGLIFSELKISIKSLLIFGFIFLKLILKKDLKWFIDNFTVSNIKVGDLIYDSYIRFGSAFKSPKFYDLKFIKLLYSTIFNTLFIQKILKQKKIKVVLVASKGYASATGICVRVATKLKIKTFLIGNNIVVNYKTYNKSFEYFRKIYPENVRLTLKNHTSNIDNFINNRFKGRSIGQFTKQHDLKQFSSTKYSKISKIDLINILRKKKEKTNFKIVLFCCNAFADAPHILGKRKLFRDYFDIFFQTIKFINSKKNENYLWIFKPHPSSKIFKEEGIVETIVNNTENSNIFMSPKNLSISKLFELSDYLVTDVSTAGLEYACLGKKPIIASDCHYSGLSFTKEPKTKKKYFDLIDNFKFNNILNKKQTNAARAALFYLENLQTKELDVNTIFFNNNNLRLSDKNYLSKFLSNFKKTEKSLIFQDLFLKKIIKYLSNKI